MLAVQITQTRHPLSILDIKMSKFNTPKNEKKLRNVHNRKDAYLQNVNNHYAKFQ